MSTEQVESRVGAAAGLCWVGIRTDRYADLVHFFRTVLGLALEHEEPDFAVLLLPDGAKVEVFGPGSLHNRHFTTGAVAGFLVDDVQVATRRLRAAGIEIVQEPGANHWAHFRAPDGRLYEVAADPALLARGQRRGS